MTVFCHFLFIPGFFLYHPKTLKIYKSTTTIKLEYTKENHVVLNEKGHKVIKFPLQMTYYKNLIQ